jgi:hypothetical protein
LIAFDGKGMKTIELDGIDGLTLSSDLPSLPVVNYSKSSP